MRITGGRAGGIPIKAPRGDSTRPATDRMREAVFSSLGALVEFGASLGGRSDACLELVTWRHQLSRGPTH